ncbi:hypothetical protein BO71DRAFT_49622 [Aspergillus ellipticus CBS 707.79]|uniref:Uncharacterized protein n=1 Tax=Aspergillus ellipticus CBS 707.79 TaxID=1448320 RepID=A0A319F1G6_9EURO|nr:hypothetical protein BO71DRAFT_49622 [Aspergillus ellipticus CBS 707.79]
MAAGLDERRDVGLKPRLGLFGFKRARAKTIRRPALRLPLSLCICTCTCTGTPVLPLSLTGAELMDSTWVSSLRWKMTDRLTDIAQL